MEFCQIFQMSEIKKIFFPTLIIFLLLIIDGFLLNDLQIETEEKFPPFETLNLDGEKITDKIFEEKISVICIWTTNQKDFKILSELEKIQKNFSDKIQIVGLVGDVRSNETEKFSAAKEISKKFSPNILQLTVNDDFFPVLGKIRIVPMTIFLDENKKIIAQPVGDANLKFVEKEIEFILKKNSPENFVREKIQKIIFER